ncbi:C39 family peptidase [Micromonospora sp. URMC 105]|uniref:C39 family peptidase n=1 Tax=unclassified Micromonospora TaxID=2617518 RepID=UPI002FF201D4
MNTIFRNGMLSVAGLVMTGGAVAAPALAAQATPAEKAASVVSDQGRDKGEGRDNSKDKGNSKDQSRAGYEYQAQPNFYYCGPTSTGMALSAAAGKTVSLDELAEKLGTTENGTDSAFDITRVLNEYTDGKYKTTELSTDVASKEQIERLRADVKAAVAAGEPIVANVLGNAYDVDGNVRGFPGHYVTVVEYKDNGNTVKIADPAAPDVQEYWMETAELANWIAGRGYSS